MLSRFTKQITTAFSAFVFGSAAFGNAAPAAIEYLPGKPLSEVIQVPGGAKPFTGGVNTVFVISWGADVATILGDMENVYTDHGLNVKVVLENNFVHQVEAVATGQTPYLRGTMGMVNFGAEALTRLGVEMFVIYQLSWSTGGDVVVVRENIKSPSDIKVWAGQYAGPHMDYIANVIRSSGRSPKQATIKWLRELTFPTYDATGRVVDSVTAFQSDPTIDAVTVISPDAMTLTSGGKIGTGTTTGSIKGARPLLSTKTANRIIADVYAVRKDWYDSHRDEVERFVHANMVSQERLIALLGNHANEQARYAKLLARSADLLMATPQATADVEGMLADCELVDYNGNVDFFTGRGTTRNVVTLTDEIQTSFVEMGLMGGRVNLPWAEWDYAKLANGLKNTNVPVASAPRFDPAKVAAKVAAEAESFAEEGTLFTTEVHFKPNQQIFPVAEYKDDFELALRQIQTYGGALVIIEGHADPKKVRDLEKKNEKPLVIDQVKLQAKNLSFLRARGVQDSFLEFCRSRKIKVEESQITATGMGITSPKFENPRTEDEWKENMRVVFRIVGIEAELDEFVPSGS